MTADAPSKAVIELVARRLTPEQQALAVSAMPVVRRVAARVHRKWPHADLNELVSIGHLVMVTQLPNWEPERGPLDAFIFTWTRFAMQKQLHPRGSRQALERGATLLEPLRDPVELAADPVEELIGRTEAQERAELSADLRVQATGLAMHTLADPATGEDDTIAELDLARGRVALDRLVATLDGDMQYFFRRHYREFASFEQIAAELGVSKRTVERLDCNLRRRAAEVLGHASAA